MPFRLFTLAVVFLLVGVPFITSSTAPYFVHVYQNTLNWGSPVARAAWYLWAAWMIWPFVNFVRLTIKYPF